MTILDVTLSSWEVCAFDQSLFQASVCSVKNMFHEKFILQGHKILLV